eukprot:4002040-Lingulodinium_polyedra.AAC.1
MPSSLGQRQETIIGGARVHEAPAPPHRCKRPPAPAPMLMLMMKMMTMMFMMRMQCCSYS